MGSPTQKCGYFEQQRYNLAIIVIVIILSGIIPKNFRVLNSLIIIQLSIGKLERYF